MTTPVVAALALVQALVAVRSSPVFLERSPVPFFLERVLCSGCLSDCVPCRWWACCHAACDSRMLA